MEGASKTASESEAPRPGILHGLSAKLLLLTMLFVMVGEVLIFVPSIANFRVKWLEDRIKTAQIATLVVEAAPDQLISDELRRELLARAGAKAIAFKRGESRHLVLAGPELPEIDAHYDIRDVTWFETIVDAVETMVAGNGRVIRVLGYATDPSGQFTELVIDERPLRKAMIAFSFTIAKLSIILSLIVATLIYYTLHVTFVRPMRRLTKNMVSFSSHPEDQSRIIMPSDRDDEIGVAERELNRMQTQLANTLQQKTRLAALGLAVSKVSHDLRNMLSSAQLISDRLGQIDDPTVKRFAPKLIASLDRAIGLCVQTLKYGRAQEAPPDRERFELRSLVDEIIDTVAPEASTRTILYNDVPPELEIDADSDHMFRVLMNMLRNAAEALDHETDAIAMGEEGFVRIRAWREGTVVTIQIADNGPGVPARARAHLFEAFQGSGRSGGTGLGLAISAELVRAHGGELILAESEKGAEFRIVIPDRVHEIRPGRRGERRVVDGPGTLVVPRRDERSS
ncbi:signal transduction histidine kinase [Rhodoligotrophos appendicifer]|uniref:sensor histidine kinase n=1 Tax=Rhodoligotrophos appendicifer TaxID=987056 RepID=UPI001FEBFC37|nr:HAMP domain-containing sensor histidine kinase [Rhodoligotrophos appendicifer]